MKTEKLYPVCKNYIWGGDKLVKEYGKTADLPCAESWEFSFHPDGLSKLSDGRTLSETATPDDLGSNCAGFAGVPLMVKLIDANADLSVQVHPTDAYAGARGLGFGKTEMWYVVGAAPGACLYVGLREPADPARIRASALDGTLVSLLNRVEVHAGDAYLIPAGTVHAIGAGCVICEIQQNSNITYRLYDHGRIGPDGKPRQLHLDDALAVADTGAYRAKRPSAQTADGVLLFANKYFTASRLTVSGTYTFTADKGSFRCVTCVCGAGVIDGTGCRAGDSFFIPADGLTHTYEGDMTLIVSANRKYAVGIDLGGTFIKGGIADDLGNVIAKGKVPTGSEDGADAVAARIAGLCADLMSDACMTADDVAGVGIGVPGMIDTVRGEVVYSNNLGWSHFPIKNEVQRLTGLPVRICNDANVAALGEAKFGAGAGMENVVMLTLGTGVGGGLILNGKLYEGSGGAGAELGHMAIALNGERCTCGRRGCLEAYASATALIRDTKRAIKEHPESLMSAQSEINGTTAFRMRDKDPYAAEVVENYISYLAAGVIDIANVFRPQAVIIGGGIGAEKENLTVPLQEKLDRDMFGGKLGPAVPVIPAALGNTAGTLGAAALWF